MALNISLFQRKVRTVHNALVRGQTAKWKIWVVTYIDRVLPPQSGYEEGDVMPTIRKIPFSCRNKLANLVPQRWVAFSSIALNTGQQKLGI